MTAPPVDKLTTIELVLFSGDRVRLRRGEVPRILFHRYALIFYLVFALALSQLRMFNEMLTMSPLERLALVALGLAGVILPTTLRFALTERRQKAGSIDVVNVSGHLLAFTLVSAFLCVHLAYTMPGRPYPKPIHFVSIWLWFYVLAEILTHCFLLVLVRRILADIRGTDRDVALDPTEATLLDIKGARVRLSDLSRVAAEGNYIRVVTAGAQHFLPGPFGPVADALPEAIGMRVSRSDWVARAAILKAQRAGRYLTLELTDGSTIRVAQAKRKAVLDWLQGLAQGDGEVAVGTATSTQTG